MTDVRSVVVAGAGLGGLLGFGLPRAVMALRAFFAEGRPVAQAVETVAGTLSTGLDSSARGATLPT